MICSVVEDILVWIFVFVLVDCACGTIWGHNEHEEYTKITRD